MTRSAHTRGAIYGTTLLAGLSLVITGCVGELRTAGEIYEEQQGPTSFNQLAQRETNIVGAGEGAAPEQALPAGGKGLITEQVLGVVTESRCHPGDLDFGQPDVWGKGSAVDGRAFSFTVEAEDGSVLAAVKLGPTDLINEAQRAASKKLNKLTRPLRVELPASLAAAGSFKANLFACVDADEDGSCADEDVEPVSDAKDPWSAMGIEMPGMDKPFASRLMASLALLATVRDGVVTFEVVETKQEKSPWGGASDFTAGLLKNMPFTEDDALAVDTPLKLKLAVRSGDPKCAFTSRDLGCFVAGTRIGTPSGALGQGKLTVVEQLGRGAPILTADGRGVTSLRSVAGPEREPVITFRTEGGHALTVTSKHPMLTEAGLKRAEDVTPADRLVAAEGPRHVAITAITRASYAGTVYNFALPGEDTRDHLVVAEGLVVGDLVLQRRLSVGAR